MDGEPYFAVDSSLAKQPCADIRHRRPDQLRRETGVHKLPHGRHPMRRLAASGGGHEYEPMGHGHDRADRLGSLVLSLPGGLAHACLLDERGEGIQLPAHVTYQFLLCAGLHRSLDSHHSLLEVSGPDRLGILADHHSISSQKKLMLLISLVLRAALARSSSCDHHGIQKYTRGYPK